MEISSRKFSAGYYTAKLETSFLMNNQPPRKKKKKKKPTLKFWIVIVSNPDEHLIIINTLARLLSASQHLQIKQLVSEKTTALMLMCICFSSQKHRTTFTNRLTHFPQFSCTIIVCPFVTYQDMYLPNICTLFCPVPANAISISTFLCVWSKRGKQFTSKGESMRNWRKESLPHSCASSM